MGEKLVTVTQGNWSVSTTSPAYEFPTADGWGGTGRVGVRISVFRVITMHPWNTQKGDHDGRWFATREEASAFLLEHGYLQWHYRRVWCPVHRRLHHFLGRPSPYLPIDSREHCAIGAGDFYGADNVERRRELGEQAMQWRAEYAARS